MSWAYGLTTTLFMGGIQLICLGILVSTLVESMKKLSSDITMWLTKN